MAFGSHSDQSFRFYPILKGYRACFSFALFALGLVGEPLSAQTVNLAQTPRPAVPIPPPQDVIPIPRPSPPVPPPTPVLPPPAELLQPPGGNTSPAETVPGETPETIVVERFEVTGSTVFSREELAEVTKPYTGRPISLAELFKARSAVTQLYIDRGYITSGAFIPPQKLQGGMVEIRVVEGELEAIKVNGTRRLRSSYIRRRLEIATGKPLNRTRLLEALQLLQLNPLINTLSAELSAGSRPGQSLLEVRVNEAKTFDASVIFDNGRSPSVGTDRRQIQLSEANLLGFGDRITASYTNTDGSNALDLGYSIPINPRNGTVSFNYGSSSSTVIEEPFDVLDIESDSRYYELSVRQPLLQTPSEEFAIGLTASRRESEATLLNGELPFPAVGSDNEGRTRVTALRFFQEWTKRSSREVIAARSQFSFGLDALNSTINEIGPDSRFFSWRGQGQWVRLLAPDTLLLIRTDLQLADRPLVPFEQFALGGQETLRGVRQDALLSDNGFFASAEVRVPILRLQRPNTLLQLAPFVDFGTIWNTSGPTPDPRTVTSVGLGLRLQVGNTITARLDYGIPLVSIESDEKSLQEKGIYFSIIVSPF